MITNRVRRLRDATSKVTGTPEASGLWVDSNDVLKFTKLDGTVVPANQPATANVTASTLTVDATYAGRYVILNRAAGIAVTLPAASGSGNIYRFLIGTTITSNTTTVKVANASDYMRGYNIGVTDTAGTADAFATANTGTVATESDTITMNGTTQGGRVGDEIQVIDVAANVFAVRVLNVGSGVEATPFSATV